VALRSLTTALTCLLCVAAIPVAAQERRQQRVLALYVTTPGAPGAVVFETTYQTLFREALGSRLDFHSEYIDLGRFSEPAYTAALVDFLRYKYRAVPPDVVLATTEASRRFAEQYQSDLFPNVPIVFVNRVAATDRVSNTTGVNAPLDLSGTLDLALDLQPETEHVFVITGLSAFDQFYERLARDQLQRFAGRVSLNFWSGFSLTDLQRQLASLPPRSVIYFLTLAEDSAGARFISVDVREQLAASANAPMYSWHQVSMDHGVIGGHLFSNEIVAARTGEIALRILRGEKAAEIPVLTVDAMVTQLDWRQLQRWRIDESRVPAGAAILFREPTLWDRYKAYISGAVALLLLQTALIAGLLVQRARRRRAERQMRDHQHMLESSNRQISELFGRLIAAQETERTRIARELHDDVSQRIAALALNMSSLKRTLQGSGEPGDALTVLGAMQTDTATLAQEIRHVSHDLHPSVLQHAGLVPALNAYCGQFGKLHGLSIRFAAASHLGAIREDVALCLYRITQEALHNVAKHAAASEVSVSLAGDADRLQLAIVDNGKGFTLAGTRGHRMGLGLVSIDERARMLGGQVTIDTRPGGGTRVAVGLPHSAIAAGPA
jgi:signal transduction histidine kinase